MATPKALVVAVALGLIAASASPVRAQSCGDADGSGTISVTDGVRVLRAAAGLEVDCPGPRCDVDGSGSVTITDGVNVLRAAVDLPVVFRCVVLSAQEQQVFGALQKANQVIGLLALGIESADGAGAAATACPGGGTVAADAGGVVYDGCRVKDTICSGTAAPDGDRFSATLACEDVARATTFALAADVAVSAAGADRAITGTTTASQGTGTAFALGYAGVTLDENAQGGRSAGEIAVEGAFFAGVFQHVDLSFPGNDPETGEPDPGFAKVVGLRSGGAGIVFVFVFDLNLRTGKLTPR